MLTDNNPLIYVLSSAKLDATGQRWVAALASFDFNILDRPGRNNSDPDGLSRLPEINNEELPPASFFVHELRQDHLQWVTVWALRREFVHVSPSCRYTPRSSWWENHRRYRGLATRPSATTVDSIHYEWILTLQVWCTINVRSHNSADEFWAFCPYRWCIVSHCHSGWREEASSCITCSFDTEGTTIAAYRFRTSGMWQDHRTCEGPFLLARNDKGHRWLD